MIRVGAVNYLNTKPLVEGLCDFAPDVELVYDLPSRLADRMKAGELDFGLIPVVEYFRAETYGHVPGVCIASRGPVLSVTLFSRVPWGEVRSVALDEGSRTSAALTQILLRKHGARPALQTLPIGAPADDVAADAVLLIGDRAMSACLPGFPHAYDLGEEWAAMTGLPFVYALWAVRDGVELSPETEEAFRRAKRLGRARAGAIAAREAPALGLGAGYCRRYLSNILHYDLGRAELAGLARFRALAAELGLAPPGDTDVGLNRPHLAESR